MDKAARLLEKALRPIVEVLGANVKDVEDIEIDPYGPRVIVQVKPQSSMVETVFIDASPDGVEAVYTVRLPRRLDKNRVEEEAASLIEASDQLQAIAGYDVSYNPETGELTIELHAKLMPELPSVTDIERLARRVREKAAP